MSAARRVRFNRVTVNLALRAVKDFASSEVRGQALTLAMVLVACLIGVNLLNVLNSYVGRDFMTAIENRDYDAFIRRFFVYLGVFAASTGVAVWCRYAEERLGLLWREWLTRRLVHLYLDRGAYYQLAISGSITSPDQRIADDVRFLTTTALAFMLMTLNALFTIIAFSGVIWSISRLLFGVAVLYAIFGSLLTIFLGGRLVNLNYDQSDKEAQMRADLIHLREHADSVVLARREGRLSARLQQRIDAVADNLRHIIVVNRNLSFFTTGYNYMIQIIPALVVAPLFIRGEVEFGVITQATMAFTHLLGAFSLIVTQFQSLSSLTAVVSRVAALREAIAYVQMPSDGPITIREENGRIAYEGLSLVSPRDNRRLVEDLSVTIPIGMRLAVTGNNQTAKIALFRATAGIWRAGSGTVVRPDLDQVLFLPERAYLPPTTLREVLLRTGQEHVISEDEIRAALRAMEVESVLTRAGGLDVERDWQALLSLGEQQLFAFARILLAAPQFALLDRPGTALGPVRLERILQLLSERKITYIHFGDANDYPELHDMVLQIGPSGRWDWRTSQ